MTHNHSFYIIFLFCLWVGNFQEVRALPNRQISVTLFGAKPNDGKNDAAALSKAAKYVQRHKNITLYFPPGIYNYANEYAQRIEKKAISGAYGEDVQSYLFRPKLPFVTALDFSKCQGITIRAYGATILLQGWYQVISLIHARNVKIEGLSILYQRPPSTIGRIIKQTSDYFDMAFNSEKYKYLDSLITGRVHFVNAMTKELYFCSITRKELIGPSLIRMYTHDQTNLNDFCVIRHSGHYRPAIMVRESSNIVLKDIKIFNQPGMGVIGHLSNDIVLDGVQIVPESGSVISTNTDATHFTSCSGDLVIRNCIFKGSGDDCTNIHNYYYNIYPQKDKYIEIKIENADIHAQWLDYPQKGDTMLVVNRKNLKEKGKYIVQKVDTSYCHWKVFVQLDKSLPFKNTQEYYMTNITRFPHVYITNNTFLGNLARGMVIKSKNVYIARNSICNCTHTAIKLGAELSWHESGPVNHVVIEDNYISHCGYLQSDSDASCISTNTESTEEPPQVNRNIIIQNNIFDSDKKYSIVLKDSRDVILLDNFSSHFNDTKKINCSNIQIR